MIRKTATKAGGYKYTVQGKSGRKMGSYRTRAAAEKRLAQVERFSKSKKS